MREFRVTSILAFVVFVLGLGVHLLLISGPDFSSDHPIIFSLMTVLIIYNLISVSSLPWVSDIDSLPYDIYKRKRTFPYWWTLVFHPMHHIEIKYFHNVVLSTQDDAFRNKLIHNQKCVEIIPVDQDIIMFVPITFKNRKELLKWALKGEIKEIW